MVLLTLLWTCAATALRLNGFHPSAINDKFTVNRIPAIRPKATSKSSELKVTSNVVGLTQKYATSLSSVYVQAMRGEAGIARATVCCYCSCHVAGYARTRLTWDTMQNATTPLISASGGQVFLANVTVGGKRYSVVIDTGSSDPWLARIGYQCYDPYDDRLLPQSECGFAGAYDPSQSTTYTAVPNQSFNISYADGEYLNGGVGIESFSMAGITVPRQQFGTVDIAAWYGDYVSTGLIGFAGRALTSAYAGSNTNAYYNPLFVNMYEQQTIPAVFSMAIDRNISVGGVLALGGIPDIQHSPYFATTPISGLSVNAQDQAVYTFYTIYIDGYAYSANRSTQFNSYDNPNPFKTPLVYNGSDTIIDSGTSLAYIPDEVMVATAALYDPPAYYDDIQGSWFVACDSKAPVFGVGVGKKIFYVNALDLIVEVYTNICVTGIQSNGGGLSILGGTWMKNVLAVFDIDGGQMQFAARQFYDLYAK